MRFRYLYILVLLALGGAVWSGCGEGIPAADVAAAGDPSKTFPVNDDDPPFLFIYAVPGFGGAGPNGVLVALWPDGRLVRAAGAQEAGKVYVQGKVSADALIDVRQKLGDSGILNGSEVPWHKLDAPVESLTVRWGDRCCTWQHNPGPDTSGGGAADPRISALRNQLMTMQVQDPSQPGPPPWQGQPSEWFK